MMDFLLKHILEIAAIVVAVIIYVLQRKRKALAYYVETNAAVISVSDTVKDEIKILFAGRPVTELRLVEIRVRNSGNLPIRPEDYIQPLLLHWSPNTHWVSAGIIDNQKLGVEIIEWPERIPDCSFALSKTLLNPKDSFVIKLLLDSGEANFSMSGRIVGVSKVAATASRRFVDRGQVRFLLGGGAAAALWLGIRQYVSNASIIGMLDTLIGGLFFFMIIALISLALGSAEPSETATRPPKK